MTLTHRGNVMLSMRPLLHDNLHQSVMTIEMKVDDLENIPFRQIKEVTGVTDEAKIINTWKNCSQKGGNEQQITYSVIESLVGGEGAGLNMKEDQSGEKQESKNTCTQVSDAEISTPVIDLTGEQDDIQKAIAASLADASNSPSMLGGNFSREEQDISRILEADYIDEQNKKKSTHSQMWLSDPTNPYERMREGTWPVGLKNVGNTCWFNAVIQSLFHISKFRNLVLHYKPSPNVNKENQMYRFMCELRQLFALLLCSNRKYLDPSLVIDIFRMSFNAGASSAPLDGQQDVSEFQHRLIDWLEEAFKFDVDGQVAEGEGQEAMEVDPPMLKEKDERNHMIQLFYGKVRITGSNAGEDFVSHPDFGQWPLHVAGFSDIHESLEASLAQGDIETNTEGQICTQEVSRISRVLSSQCYQLWTNRIKQWFTRLPPVLTFELSRFEFHSELTRVEKLHNKFSFPEFLYLDRYMECNKAEVSHKRQSVKQMKTALNNFKMLLHSYTHYSCSGLAEKAYPLTDILDCTLQFATTSECNCPKLEVVRNEPSTSKQADIADKLSVCTCPRPDQVTAEERQTLKNCLTRWREEAKNQVAKYEETIARLSNEMAQTYEHEDLKKHLYRLHAVLVHQGEAASGHYWSYIYSPELSTWLKFNDSNVSRCNWLDVCRTSEGGFGNASAYCLMYVDMAQDAVGGVVTQDADLDVATLPADLAEIVNTDKQKFTDELQSWTESQQQQPATDQNMTAAKDEPDIVAIHRPAPASSPTPMACEDVNGPSDSMTTGHAQSMMRVFQKYSAGFNSEPDVGTALKKIINQLYSRYTQAIQEHSARMPYTDARSHMPVHMMASDANVRVADVQCVIADLIAKLLDSERVSTDRHLEMKKLAMQFVMRYKQENPNFGWKLNIWHENFHQFCKVVTLFVYALTHYNDGKYEEALPYFHECYISNEKIIASADRGRCETRGLDPRFIAEGRRKCLEKFNEMAICQFENEEDFRTPLGVIVSNVLPILDCLQADGSEIDSNTVSVFKDRWVALLGEELDEPRTSVFNEFMVQLFEPAPSPSPDLLSGTSVLTDLGSRYREAVTKYIASLNES